MLKELLKHSKLIICRFLNPKYFHQNLVWSLFYFVNYFLYCVILAGQFAIVLYCISYIWKPYKIDYLFVLDHIEILTIFAMNLELLIRISNSLESLFCRQAMVCLE